MGKPVDSDKINIIKLAHLHYQAGRWDNTIEEYRKLLEMDPQDMNVHKMLGDVYVKKNELTLAYDEYSKVVSHFISLGQMDKATQVHEKIARLDKKQLLPEAQRKQSLIQLRRKADKALEADQVQEALEVFGEIVKLDPEDRDAAAKLAELEEKTSGHDQAVERYARLGESYLKSHLYKKAQEMFRKASVLDPQNTAVRVQLAKIYAKQGSDSEAKKEYLNVAEKALAQNDLDTAMDCAGKAVELKSIEAYYIVGVVLFKRRMWAAAKVAFDHLLRFKVNHASGQVYLAKVYAAMSQPEKALEGFQKALKMEKDGLFALEAWAEFCVKQKDPEGAVDALTILIQRAENEGDLNRAVELARTLVSVDPSRFASQVKLEQLSRGQKEPVVEESPLRIPPDPVPAVEAAPSTPDAIPVEESIASVFSKKTAVKDRRLTDRISTEDSAIKFSLKAEEAAPELKPPAVEVTPQEAFQAQIGLADQYVQQGLLEEAIAIYQQLLEGVPDHPLVKEKLNQVYSVYARTGTDLTRVFAAVPAVVEEARKMGLEEAQQKLNELEMKALAEAEQKIWIELGKKERGEAKKVNLIAAQRRLQELEEQARQEAEEKIKAGLGRRAREEAEKKAGVEPKNSAAKKEKAALVPASPVLRETATVAVMHPPPRKRSNKIGYV